MAREIIKESGGHRLKTFSAIYDEVPECDERFYINPVVAQGDVQPFYAHADHYSPLTDWGDTVECDDEPLWNPQMALHWALYETACQQQVRVLLDGFAGDAVVSHGVSYLNELAYTGQWGKLLTEAKQYARRVDCSFWKLLKWRGPAPLIPQFVWRGWRVVKGQKERSEYSDVLQLLRPEFVARINLRDRLASLQVKASMPQRSSRQSHLLQLTTGLWPFSLSAVDRAAALFNIERRQPFLDRRLVEFCLALPAEQKMRQGWTRRIARDSMTNILPKEVQWRVGKTNHSSNFNHKMLTSDRKILEKVINQPSERLAQYVDIATLRQLYYRYLSQARNKDGFLLWRVVKLAIWLESQDKGKRACENLRGFMFQVNHHRANLANPHQYTA